MCPSRIEIGVICIDHCELPQNGLLRVNVTILTVREAPHDAPQRIIDEPALERRLTQTARRQATPRRRSASVHRTQRHLLVVCYSSKNETHDVHQAIVVDARRRVTATQPHPEIRDKI
jgi:hypothetical protein